MAGNRKILQSYSPLVMNLFRNHNQSILKTEKNEKDKEKYFANDLEKLKSALTDLSEKYAPKVKGIRITQMTDGSTQLVELVEKESGKKSDFPIKHDENETLSVAVVEEHPGQYPLTQAAIKYLKVMVNTFAKKEKHARDVISIFVAMFMNRENMATEFGRELQKIIEDIPFLVRAFDLSKGDCCFRDKIFNYQKEKYEEMVLRYC